MASQSPTALDAPLIFRIGAVLNEAFEIRALLGEGGMGQVFEAHDALLNRRVAIKVCWAHVEPGVLRREAQALAAIRHPSMVTVHGIGCHDGTEYVVMERVYGVELDAYLERHRSESTRLAIDDALAILIPLADALTAVHRAGIAHRDIKPANIMLAPGGRLVLMDFGIFVSASQMGDQSMVSGTPEYMAPETITATAEARTSSQVDIYAFGILAYELLAGQTPFQGEDRRAILKQHLMSAARPLTEVRSDVPAKLAALVGELLAKDPDLRPQSMEAVTWRLRATTETRKTAFDEPFRVLVVDDDVAISKLLAMIVKRAIPTALVETADSASEALDKITAAPPALMLLDLHMPKMTGIELCMYLRGAPHLAERCTIVPVSAGAQDPDLQLLQQLGITRFVSKEGKLADRLAPILREVHDAWRAG